MPRAVEVEWQFVVRDVDAFERWLVARRFPRWSVTFAGEHRLADVYLDTADWRVWHDGFALRRRKSGARAEATLKALARTPRGPARRREITAALRDPRPATFRALRGPLGVRLRRVVGSRRLRTLFALRTRRRTFTLRRDGRPVAEIALDRTRLVVRRRGADARRLERLEIELTTGSPAVVARFVATVRRERHLTRAARSKFEEGLRSARLRPPTRR